MTPPFEFSGPRRSFVKKTLATSASISFAGLIRAHGEEGGGTASSTYSTGDGTISTSYSTGDGTAATSYATGDGTDFTCYTGQATTAEPGWNWTAPEDEHIYEPPGIPTGWENTRTNPFPGPVGKWKATQTLPVGTYKPLWSWGSGIYQSLGLDVCMASTRGSEWRHSNGKIYQIEVTFHVTNMEHARDWWNTHTGFAYYTARIYTKHSVDGPGECTGVVTEKFARSEVFVFNPDCDPDTGEILTQVAESVVPLENQLPKPCRFEIDGIAYDLSVGMQISGNLWSSGGSSEVGEGDDKTKVENVQFKAYTGFSSIPPNPMSVFADGPMRDEIQFISRKLPASPVP